MPNLKNINKKSKPFWITLTLVIFTIMFISMTIENLVTAKKHIKNKSIITEGKKVYKSTCAMCHMADLKSGLSNLLAPKLKYGNSAKSIMKVIKNGTSKGMPPQGNILSKKQIEQVTAYIIHVRKKNKL